MNAFRVWDGQHTFLFIMQHVCGLGYLAWKHVGNTLGQCWKHVGPMSETGWSNTSLLALGQRKSNEQNHVWPNVWLTRRANKRTLVGPTLAKPKIVVGVAVANWHARQNRAVDRAWQWSSVIAWRYYQLSWPTTVQFSTLWTSTILELNW